MPVNLIAIANIGLRMMAQTFLPHAVKVATIGGRRGLVFARVSVFIIGKQVI